MSRIVATTLVQLHAVYNIYLLSTSHHNHRGNVAKIRSIVEKISWDDRQVTTDWYYFIQPNSVHIATIQKGSYTSEESTDR